MNNIDTLLAGSLLVAFIIYTTLTGTLNRYLWFILDNYPRMNPEQEKQGKVSTSSFDNPKGDAIKGVLKDTLKNNFNIFGSNNVSSSPSGLWKPSAGGAFPWLA